MSLSNFKSASALVLLSLAQGATADYCDPNFGDCYCDGFGNCYDDCDDYYDDGSCYYWYIFIPL